MRNKKLNCFIRKLFSLLLLALGFSACDSTGPRDMYGSPTAEFTIKGKVVEADSKEKPLQDIRIVIYPLPEQEEIYHTDTLFTDKNGEFELKSHGSGIDREYRIVYEEQEKYVGEIPLKKGHLDVELKQIEKGKGAWDWGKYEADILIEMEKDTSVEPE